MARKIKPILTEILEMIAGVQTATANKSLNDFKQDWLLKLAIQRALEIISEASRHIPDELLEREPNIPWKQIRGIGNILRHEYHKIADDIVWAVVTSNLPPLKVAVETLASDIEADDTDTDS